MVSSCLVPNCNNNSNNQVMRRLPSNQERFRQWLIAVKREDLLANAKHTYNSKRICDVHFSADSHFQENRNRTNLKTNSMPTLFLPGSIHASGEVLSTTNPLRESDTSNRSDDALINELRSESTTIRKKKKIGSSPPKKVVKKTKSSIPNKSIVSQPRQLAVKDREVYDLIKNLNQKANDLEKQNATNKERIKQALKFTQSNEFLRTKVDKAKYISAILLNIINKWEIP